MLSQGPLPNRPCGSAGKGMSFTSLLSLTGQTSHALLGCAICPLRAARCWGGPVQLLQVKRKATASPGPAGFHLTPWSHYSSHQCGNKGTGALGWPSPWWGRGGRGEEEGGFGGDCWSGGDDLDLGARPLHWAGGEVQGQLV